VESQNKNEPKNTSKRREGLLSSALKLNYFADFQRGQCIAGHVRKVDFPGWKKASPPTFPIPIWTKIAIELKKKAIQ
jgi:hypothetical protein